MPRNYHTARADILQALPGTHDHLVARSGWSYDTVRRWLKVLRANNEAHIGGWERAARGDFRRVYHAGPGPDVPCTLQPLTPSEDWQRRKKRLNVDGINVTAQQERARYWARRARLHGDPMLNWIPRRGTSKDTK